MSVDKDATVIRDPSRVDGELASPGGLGKERTPTCRLAAIRFHAPEGALRRLRM